MTTWLEFFRRSPKTASIAKDRLQIIVARERHLTRCGPGYLPQMQQELLAVIAKYEDVDLDQVSVSLEQEGDHDVLEVNIVLPEEETARALTAALAARF